MEAKVLGFGSIRIDGVTYDHDLVIDRGKVRKRKKGPSKQYRDRYGHTPLSLAEDIPWGGRQLIIGTGVDGALPVMPEVSAEARRRGIDLVAVPTTEACLLIEELDEDAITAVLHVTC